MRIMLASICAILLLSSCTKYTDEQFFAAINRGDAKTVQAIINQRDMTKVGNGLAFSFDAVNFKYTLVPIAQVPYEQTHSNGFSGLWVAVEKNNPAIIKILLQQKFDLMEEHMNDENSSVSLLKLVAAKESCDPSIIRLFAENGADFNAVTSNDNTPVILFAAFAGYWHCVHALIGIGVDTNVTRPSGSGLLSEAAVQAENVDIDYLIQQMKGFDPLSSDAGFALLIATRKGDIRLVKNFLNRGFNECFNNKGKYARDIAISENHIEIAALLPTKEQCGFNKEDRGH